jgi:hypothetical protein
MTLTYLLVLLALLSACAGVGNVTLPRFTPNWVALALAFYFASMVVR